MQSVPIYINIIGLLIFVGICFGLFISYFLIRKSIHNKSPNLYMGILILVLSLIMFEGWLNYTGYIFKVLWLTNFSEPLNFVIAPLIYLFMARQLGRNRSNKDWLHFVPFLIWFIYCLFFFSLIDEFKYNDNISVMNLNIPPIETTKIYNGDPLGIRNHVNLATIIHILTYMAVVTYRLIKSTKKRGESIFKTTDKTLKSLRNSFYHFLIITLILIFVKITFKSDVGDYLIFLYICFMIFLTGFQIMNTSPYYTEISSFLEGPVLKYKKSSLLEDQKDMILKRVINQMKHEKFYISSSASLSDLSKAIKESSHHVSQVINERLNQTFFELLATYRIDEAKAILKTDLGKKLTIEEIAESVGYNSKSAFNSAFKKITSQTPSQFRDL